MTTENNVIPTTPAGAPDKGVGRDALLAEWPEDRWTELVELRDMLGELRQINNGSGAIQRLLKCVEVAQKLTTTDYRGCRKSFLLFLEDRALPRQPANTTVSNTGANTET